MPELTKTQRAILSAAARRHRGSVLPLPKSLKIQGGAATKTLKSLLAKGLVVERPADRGAGAWRETDDGRSMTLLATGAGLQAIGARVASSKSKRAAPDAKNQRRRSDSGTATDRTKTRVPQSAVRPGTKRALLIDLLSRKRGATIGEAVEATGWQPHSVRGAISGTLKRKLGLAVASETVEGRGRVYRVVAG